MECAPKAELSRSLQKIMRLCATALRLVESPTREVGGRPLTLLLETRFRRRTYLTGLRRLSPVSLHSRVGGSCPSSYYLESRLLRHSLAYGVRVGQPPNKRLKLTGGDRLKGSGVFVPWRARTFVQRPCADERVARSLSAIR